VGAGVYGRQEVAAELLIRFLEHSLAAASPQRTGEATTGFSSLNAGEVDLGVKCRWGQEH